MDSNSNLYVAPIFKNINYKVSQESIYIFTI